MSWTIDEWFVIALARTIRPRETVFHGFGSPCAQVAMYVARRTHAPDILLVEGAMYAINPDPPFIPPTSNDASLSRGAAYSMRFEEFFDAAIRGDVDRMFLSGGQIDGQGNINLVTVGDYDRPKVRFPGSFGSAYLYYVVPKVILFRTEHSRRTLVPKVDFISAPGGSADNIFRPGGPIALVTNRCLFDFDRARRRFRLASVHPGHSVAEVIENTGFDFDRPAEVPTTPAPTPETLELMRSVVAPQLAEVYPQFAKSVFNIVMPREGGAPSIHERE